MTVQSTPMKSLALQLLANRLLRQFLIFASVGVVATGVHYTILILLVERGGLAPVIATTIGLLVGAIVSYTLNRRLTFEARPAVGSSFAKFLGLGSLGAGMNAGIVAGLSALHVHYLLAQAVATCIVLFWNYFSARYFVFRD